MYLITCANCPCDRLDYEKNNDSHRRLIFGMDKWQQTYVTWIMLLTLFF